MFYHDFNTFDDRFVFFIKFSTEIDVFELHVRNPQPSKTDIKLRIRVKKRKSQSSTKSFDKISTSFKNAETWQTGVTLNAYFEHRSKKIV